MQASQWTTEIIVITAILALVCVLLGYFTAALRQGRQLSLLAAQLEQAQQAQATAVAGSAALSEQLKAAEARAH
ncbi:DNA recombination protein RmuC, partial [Pseudomonas aeruginosa]|nr:DNA recombination protein RmuC [Pseudomonas aeruginosa]